ncbi:simple sugar transport system permease protein [Treponema rectale]|uniref:Simple sugar transport system permease protein n=1 Tax=Treponema rectale TaxID=744512 RepID=A0A840SFB6_9SPIR|nr:ABC transporter permease [Treponema rectale]MBB5219584.1 simple sugar transport system permease protein [Treponema rectale]
MKNNILESESFKSIVSAVFCALLGILAGFIVLLFINAEHAGEGIQTILLNFLNFPTGDLILENLGNTLVQAVPLILCGLSVLFAYKAGLFNIGAGGQYCIAIAVTLTCAVRFHMPWYLCLIFAILSGALWGALAGFFKAMFNVNEVIACIMLNWIGLYITNTILKRPAVMNSSKSLTYNITAVSPDSLLPKMGLDKVFNCRYATIAIPLAIIVAIAILIVLTKTTFGYELRATGFNKNAAKYAGMKAKTNIIITMAISGALAGMAAGLYYLTDMQQWETSAAVPGMGFNGIAVAFLGGLNPIGTIFAGFFIQHITSGGAALDTTYYNPHIADLISSIIIYLCSFVLIFKTIITKFTAKKNRTSSKEAA